MVGKRPPRLTNTYIQSLKEPCKRGDGHGSHGLTIVVRERAGGGLRRFWRQTLTIDGKKKNIGLGSYALVSLKAARKKAFDNASRIALGEDIFKPKRVTPTVAKAFDRVIADRTPEWEQQATRKARKAKNSWNLSKNTYCRPILSKKVSDVTAEDVLDILRPIWIKHSSTAQKVQSHLKQVMDWAIQLEFRTTNPAIRPAIRSLGKQPAAKPHDAAPYEELGSYLATIRDSDYWWANKYCLIFLAFTEDRSDEAREATWNEVDFDKATLTIPAHRMKNNVEHVIPLPTQAMEIVRFAKSKGIHSKGSIFWPQRGGVFVPEDGMSKITRELNLPFEPHGLRASFKTWTDEQRGEQRDLAERSLSHVVGKPSERTYSRTILLDQRRKLLQEYADFLTETMGPVISPNDL